MSKRLHTRDIMESTMVQEMCSAKKPMWAKNILQGEVVSMAEIKRRSGVVVAINKIADERAIQLEIPERERERGSVYVIWGQKRENTCSARSAWSSFTKNLYCARARKQVNY